MSSIGYDHFLVSIGVFSQEQSISVKELFQKIQLTRMLFSLMWEVFYLIFDRPSDIDHLEDLYINTFRDFEALMT